MIKAVMLFRRCPGMTREQCVEHWRNVHGPLVCSSGIGKRYVRTFVECEILSCLPPGAPEADGLAELWFDSTEDFQAFFSDPEYAAEVAADACKSADTGALQILITEETAII